MSEQHTHLGRRLPTQRVASTFRPAFELPPAPLPGPTSQVHDRALSQVLTERLDALVPGGAVTASRGTAAFPLGSAPVLTRGQGSHVWDVDGNRYVELGSGAGTVALGHRHHRVTDAVRAALDMGESFSRPLALEIDAAETLLSVVPGAEMVCLVGSGTEALRVAGEVARRLTGTDPVVVDATTADLRRDCDAQGRLLVLDERRTAFRLTAGSGPAPEGAEPDLRVLGGALGNGFAVAAVTGPRDLLRHAVVEHGAEAHALAAATAVLEAHRKEDVVATLDWVGRFLAEQVHEALDAVGLTPHVVLSGPPADLSYDVLDAAGRPCTELRSLFLGAMLDRGVLAPTLQVSAALTDGDVQHVADGVHQAAQVLRLALTEGLPAAVGLHRR